MHVIHDNFRESPMHKIWCISSTRWWTGDQFMVFRNIAQGVHVVKHPLSLTSIEQKKQRWIQKPCHHWDRALCGKVTIFASEKEQKNLKDTLATQKNIKKVAVSKSKLIGQKHCRNAIVSFCGLLNVNFILHLYFK